MRRLLRGSLSRSSKDQQSEKNKKPKYNLPRTAEVRLCEWPSDTFLKEAGIYDDFYYLADNVSIIPFFLDKYDQYPLFTKPSCKISFFILGRVHPW